MVKISELIKPVTTVLPVCGASVTIKERLSFADETKLREMDDRVKQGEESLRRVLISWDIVLEDGTQAPPSDDVLSQLSTTDFNFLMQFINDTLTAPRTPQEAEQQKKNAEAMDALMEQVSADNAKKAEPEAETNSDIDVTIDDEIEEID